MSCLSDTEACVSLSLCVAPTLGVPCPCLSAVFGRPRPWVAAGRAFALAPEAPAPAQRLHLASPGGGQALAAGRAFLVGAGAPGA